MVVCLWLGQTHLSAAETPRAALIISGAVKTRVELTLVDLRGMTRASAKVPGRDGTEQEFEGVRLWDVIQKARSFDANEHKELVNTCVIIKASDGYQAVFSLAEIAPSMSDRVVILADRCDGKSLPEADGLLRIVAPGEKMRARWVQQVTGLEIVSLLSHKEK
jgi:hypothetical protein